jgi:hypothetical protein
MLKLAGKLWPIFFLLNACGEDETLVRAEPVAKLSEEVLAFGSMTVGDPLVEKTFEIQNLGVADLEVTLTLSANFTMDGFVGPSDGTRYTIKPRAEQTVTIKFTPPRAETFDAHILMRTNDQYNNELKVTVAGTGLAPSLCVQPTSISFGDVQIGGIATRSLALKNCGDAALELTSIERAMGSSSRFSVSNLPELPLTLAPNATRWIELHFAPTEDGVATDTITFSGVGIEAPVAIDLSGKGTPPPLCFTFDPDPVNMGTILPGQSLSSTVTVHNCSDISGSWIERIRIVGTSSGAFRVRAAPVPVEVQAGGQMQIELEFEGEFQAEYNASLQILDSANVILGAVNLRATVEPVCAVNPNCCGSSCPRTWQLSRDGTFDRSNSNGQPLSWTVALEEPATTTAEVLASDGMYSNVLEINNPVNDADGDWDRIYQLTGVKVQNCGRLIFSADGKAMEQTLTGAGRTSGEYPVHFRVFYKDAAGQSQRWQHGLYYRGMHEARYDAFSTKVTQNTWHNYVSMNLMDIDPPPAEIVRIEVGASGWAYQGRIDNVSMIASEPNCP